MTKSSVEQVGTAVADEAVVAAKAVDLIGVSGADQDVVAVVVESESHGGQCISRTVEAQISQRQAVGRVEVRPLVEDGLEVGAAARGQAGDRQWMRHG